MGKYPRNIHEGTTKEAGKGTPWTSGTQGRAKYRLSHDGGGGRSGERRVRKRDNTPKLEKRRGEEEEEEGKAQKEMIE